jgi:hypothetical protein
MRRVDQPEAVIYRFPVPSKTNTAEQAEVSATEDAGALPTGDSGGAKSTSRSFLGAARQNLSPEDFKNAKVAPIIARFLIDDCENLIQEKLDLRAELRSLRTTHAGQLAENGGLKVQIAELTAKTKTLTVNEILYFVCSAAGAAGFPVMLGIEGLKGGEELGIVGMVICGILVVGSIGLRSWALFK